MDIKTFYDFHSYKDSRVNREDTRSFMEYFINKYWAAVRGYKIIENNFCDALRIRAE